MAYVVGVFQLTYVFLDIVMTELFPEIAVQTPTS